MGANWYQIRFDNWNFLYLTFYVWTFPFRSILRETSIRGRKKFNSRGGCDSAEEDMLGDKGRGLLSKSEKNYYTSVIFISEHNGNRSDACFEPFSSLLFVQWLKIVVQIKKVDDSNCIFMSRKVCKRKTWYVCLKK